MNALRIGRRTALLALLAIVLIGVIAYAVSWSLGACRPLDRLLGRSACVASLMLEGVDLLAAEALSPTEAGDEASLFALLMTEEGWRPGLVRVDLQAGRELERFPLPDSYTPVTIRHSRETPRTLILCAGPGCTPDGPRAAVVSTADGALVETISGDPYALREFWPERPTGHGPFAFHAGENIVEVEHVGAVRLLTSEGELIAPLLERDTPWALRRGGFALSPSGRFLAALDSDPVPSARAGATLFVWDARTGAERARLILDRSYRMGRHTLPVWSRDEDRLFLVREVGPDAIIDTFALPEGSTDR